MHGYRGIKEANQSVAESDKERHDSAASGYSVALKEWRQFNHYLVLDIASWLDPWIFESSNRFQRM